MSLWSQYFRQDDDDDMTTTSAKDASDSTQKSSGNSTNSSEASNASSSPSPRIQMQLSSRKRKRTRTANAESSSNNNSPLGSSSSSSSSSDEDDENNLPRRRPPHKNGWRVKLYRLNTDGSWDDRGTGRIVCHYNTQPKPNASDISQVLGEPTLVMKSEQDPQTVLLRSKILLREAYQRQGDNIVTWCEPYYPEDQARDSKNTMHPGVSQDGKQKSNVSLGILPHLPFFPSSP